MLYKFRQFQTTIFAKLFLGLIAAIFIITSAAELISSSGDYNIVTFGKLDNIKFSEFVKFRSGLLDAVSRNLQPGELLDKETNNQVSSVALSMLIRKRITDGIVKDLGIEIGDKLVASRIKSWPIFLNSEGKFDLEIYKNYMSQSSIPKKVFFNEVKSEVAQNLLNLVISGLSIAPNFYRNTIEENNAIVKNVDIVHIKLNEKNNSPSIKPSDQELEEFYSKNLESFKRPEKRHIDFVIINTENLRKLHSANSSQDSAKIKTKVTESDNAADHKFQTPIRDIEDLVAGGAKLSEIGAKYNSNIKHIVGDKNSFVNNKDLGIFVDQIFSLQNPEISYPYEVENGILVFELKSIDQQTYPPLHEVKKLVLDLYTQDRYRRTNLLLFQEFRAGVKNNSLTSFAKTNNYNCKNVNITTSNQYKDNEMSIERIISASILNGVSEPIFLGDDAYIYQIKSANLDQNLLKPKHKSNSQSIKSDLDEMLIDEVIKYYYDLNNPKIHSQFQGESL
ncbi:MAG: hypothetical protein EB127_09740 [Alphaproteobacteria bacterium]|nr:hypothetical protein [Alphaproteobacteria bacterium]